MLTDILKMIVCGSNTQYHYYYYIVLTPVSTILLIITPGEMLSIKHAHHFQNVSKHMVSLDLQKNPTR